MGKFALQNSFANQQVAANKQLLIGACSRVRRDNSLGELTKKVMTLIKEANNGSVDLNEAAAILKT